MISLSYIAGFFDGEGSIGLYSRKGKYNCYSLRCQLTQNKSLLSSYILNFLREKYGGNITEQVTLSKRIKLNWQLNVNGVRLFLIDILPYLILKKEQAVLALYWIDNRPKINRSLNGTVASFTDDEVKFSEDIETKLKQLKK